MARISKRPEIYLQLSKHHSSSECSEYKCEQPSSNSSLLTRLTSNYQLKAEKNNYLYPLAALAQRVTSLFYFFQRVEPLCYQADSKAKKIISNHITVTLYFPESLTSLFVITPFV